MEQAITLLQLNRTIAKLVANPATQNVWVVAELSDVGVRGGHCYCELLEKDDRGLQVAKARAVIWANNYSRIAAEFYAATGQRFASGMKVMLCASASMHPVYGLSLVVSAVNPEFTMGDLLRRRQESLMKLKQLGILEDNRRLTLPVPLNRIAVVSAQTAAGYGDFLNQLLHNPSRLRYRVKLFPAIVQGESAPASIISALEAIACDDEGWDCVVLIRGGGASSDLLAFEDYSLAETIAQFPLPVLIGIGHERDVTLLDYVANTRLKTPTAVAEFIVSVGDTLLANLQRMASSLLQLTTDRIAATKEQLAYYQGLIPIAPVNAVTSASNRLTRATMNLNGISSRRIIPALERLNVMAQNLPSITAAALSKANLALDGKQQLVNALSPQTVLARGYSITRIDGRAVTSASGVKPGQTIETILAGGSLTSTVNLSNASTING